MPEFVSEPIVPSTGGFDVTAMARGEPGLPTAFRWRDETYSVIETVRQWKHSERESGGVRGELYLRRHYYSLRMSDNSIWVVYFIRQPAKSGASTSRWFLYSVESASE